MQFDESKRLPCGFFTMKTIKDGKGRLIGFLHNSSTKIQAFSHQGYLIGYYHKGLKRSFDKHGVVFSDADSTVALIHANSPFKR
jgi:hypothetical protein